MKTIHVFEHVKLCWIECTCFGIYYSGNSSSNASKATRSSCTAINMQSCFELFNFMV